MELAPEQVIKDLIAKPARNRHRQVKGNTSGNTQPCKECRATVTNVNMPRCGSIAAVIEGDRFTLMCSECGAVVAAIKLAMLIRALNEAGLSDFRSTTSGNTLGS